MSHTSAWLIRSGAIIINAPFEITVCNIWVNQSSHFTITAKFSYSGGVPLSCCCSCVVPEPFTTAAAGAGPAITMDISWLLCFVLLGLLLMGSGKTGNLQIGQVTWLWEEETESHMSMQSTWNAWPHLGSLRPFSPSSRPFKQIAHSKWRPWYTNTGIIVDVAVIAVVCRPLLLPCW